MGASFISPELVTSWLSKTTSERQLFLDDPNNPPSILNKIDLVEQYCLVNRYNICCSYHMFVDEDIWDRQRTFIQQFYSGSFECCSSILSSVRLVDPTVSLHVLLHSVSLHLYAYVPAFARSPKGASETERRNISLQFIHLLLQCCVVSLYRHRLSQRIGPNHGSMTETKYPISLVALRHTRCNPLIASDILRPKKLIRLDEQKSNTLTLLGISLLNDSRADNRQVSTKCVRTTCFIAPNIHRIGEGISEALQPDFMEPSVNIGAPFGRWCTSPPSPFRSSRLLVLQSDVRAASRVPHRAAISKAKTPPAPEGKIAENR